MHVYKGAKFWKDAAVKYLSRNVLKTDVSSPSLYLMLAFGGLLISSALAFGYMKKTN